MPAFGGHSDCCGRRIGWAFAAACVMAAAALWWAFELVWRVLPMPALHHASIATFSHALVMSLGFCPCSSWASCSQPAPNGCRCLMCRPPVGQACVGLLGGVAGFVGGHLREPTFGCGQCGLAALGWSVLSGRFALVVHRSLVADRLHATLIAVSCGLGAVLMWVAALSLLFDQLEWVRLCAYLGLSWFVVPVYTAVAHRMIPALHGGGRARARQLAPLLAAVVVDGADLVAWGLGGVGHLGLGAKQPGLVGAGRRCRPWPVRACWPWRCVGGWCKA